MHKGPTDASRIPIHWEKPILMKGKAGSGKSETICQSVKQCIGNSQNILVAAPTGFLSTQFRAILPDEVTFETVHSAFFIPVNVTQPPSVNWAISKFDIVMIDEISMISECNFQHILNKFSRLMLRPVLVLGGDNAQQQPFEKSKNVTVNISNPLTCRPFLSSVYQYTLSRQHQVGDLFGIFGPYRNWTPNDTFKFDFLQVVSVLRQWWKIYVS